MPRLGSGVSGFIFLLKSSGHNLLSGYLRSSSVSGVSGIFCIRFLQLELSVHPGTRLVSIVSCGIFRGF